MQDFMKVLVMLLLVFAGMLGYIFLFRWLGLWGIIILEFVITTCIVILAIRFVRSRRL